MNPMSEARRRKNERRGRGVNIRDPVPQTLDEKGRVASQGAIAGADKMAEGR
jgi:hypothetical protein